MKDIRYKILISITAVVVLTAGVVSIVFTQMSKNKQVLPQSSTVSTAVQEYKYIVKEYNGKLAVFETGYEKPFRVTDLDVAMLTVSDRSLLSEGIRVHDNKELARVLEDFCS